MNGLSDSRPSGIIRLVDGNSQWSMVNSASGNGTKPYDTGFVYQIFASKCDLQSILVKHLT